MGQSLRCHSFLFLMAVNILAFGDSLTEGLCNKYSWEMKPYTNRLQTLLGEEFEVHNAGVSGEETSSMLTRLPKLLKNNQYKFVFILGGTNDMSTLKAETISQNLIKLHRYALTAGCISFALSIPEMKFGSSLFKNEKRITINRALEDFAEQNENCFFVPWADAIPNNYARGDSHPMWSDNIHLSQEGYEKMGTVIFDLCHQKLQ